jgi:tetratricopeptide (TPR) repeat protein
MPERKAGGAEAATPGLPLVGGGRPESHGNGPAPARGDWLVGLVLLAATLITYRSVWHAGFIWDDNGHVTRADLRPLSGLWRIWFEPGATQQYYPLLHSAFWLEYRLWAGSALGYHLANVVLHAAAAFLLYRLLRRLSVPGALLGASAFALHPVCAESVAWISEQKNTLSAVFCLAAALVHLRYDRERRFRWYALGIGLFVMALAAKSVAATLPAALLVILWWKRGRLSWKGEVAPLVPWLCAATAAGAVTVWVERTYIGASGAAFSLSFADRVLVAGRVLWFYLEKIFWPANLVFIYPHWAVDARAGWQYLFPAAAAVTLAVLFAIRGRMRGPLASALLFCGTLFPALGFIDVYPFVYSYVADHFQYLAAAIAISAAAAALATAAARLPGNGRFVATIAAAGIVAGLSLLTARQCTMYADAETLWRTTIARNPGCWMAYENLGGVFLNEGRVDQAEKQFQGALEINPRDVGALNELGVAMLREGRVDQAVAQLRRALEIAPNNAETRINLGAALLGKQQAEEAAAHLQQALKMEPKNTLAHKDLARALFQEGRRDEAIAELRTVVDIDPGDAEARNSLGAALMRGGRLDQAVAQFERSVEIDGGYAEAHFNLANALLMEGKADEAVAEFHKAVAIRPDYADAHNNLANALLKRGEIGEAIAHFRRAVEINVGSAEAHFNLANALLLGGRVDEAIAELRRAVEIRPGFAEAHDNLAGALLQEGRLDEAAEHFQRALELEPNNAQVHNDLGAVLMEEGRAGEAVGHYRKALEIKPDFAPALVNLGNFSLKRGSPAQADADYRKALEIEPENARVHNNLGIALIEEGRAGDAAVQFRMALKIDPGYSEARRNLDVALRQAGRKDRDESTSEDAPRPK